MTFNWKGFENVGFQNLVHPELIFIESMATEEWNNSNMSFVETQIFNTANLIVVSGTFDDIYCMICEEDNLWKGLKVNICSLH